MQEKMIITDEAYRADMEKLWRVIRRYRDTTKYKDVSFKGQSWMLTSDGEKIKSGTAAAVSFTDLFFTVPYPPTNGEMIAVMKAAGLDVDTELPVRLTFTLDIDYTPI